MKNTYNSKRVAIVYDWIDKWGGVERILLYLHTLFPDAVFFTSAYDTKKATWASSLTIKSSFLQRLPACLRSHRLFMMPLYPFAFESFDFSQYDLVISVTSSYAKGIITKPGTKHVCYLLTPMRYAWSHSEEYLPMFPKQTVHYLSNILKKFDIAISTRPDVYISISKTVAERCKENYKVQSPVVYPPFDTNYWLRQEGNIEKNQHINLPKEYFLWVGRMERYKHAELIVKAALGMPQKNFVFVGTGEQSTRLRKIAPRNCIFLGKRTDSELAYLYMHAHALIMPQNEDFGYIALEAQFFGCPVIAYGKGGALETVLDGKTGIFFHSQTVQGLVASLARFDQISYNLIHEARKIGRAHVKKFDSERFETDFIYQLAQL